MSSADEVGARVRSLPWDEIVDTIDRDGFAVTPAILDPDACAELRALFDEDDRFRSTVDMARHQFGEGRYRYFAHPLPAPVAGIREAAYGPLAALANEWADRLGLATRYPSDFEDLVSRCADAGQRKPTPLLLRYEVGGWNALHQDLYGEIAFPLQLTVALSAAGRDFEGGENLLVEQRPRKQSRGTAVVVPQGRALVFPTRHRPLRSERGWYRATVRHGVSTLTAGQRVALGVIFHDAS